MKRQEPDIFQASGRNIDLKQIWKKKSQVLEKKFSIQLLNIRKSFGFFLKHNYYSVFRTVGFLFKRAINFGLMI